MGCSSIRIRRGFGLDTLDFTLYRNAVASHSPGLPLWLPWDFDSSIIQPQRGCVPVVATRSGLIMRILLTQG
jgi:hypothetical protein